MTPSPPPFHFHPLKSSTMPMKLLRPDPPEYSAGGRPRTQALLRPHRRTNPFIWFAAFLCVILIVLLIAAGILTLIIFLIIKPRNPSFDTTSATLNAIYLDSPAYLNADLTFLANFSNPNTKIDVVFEYASIELYFLNRLVAAQLLPPFVQRRGEAKLQAVHMISSQVYLPPEIALELVTQVRTNRVFYSVRGTFRVRAIFGVGHLSYWLYGRCQIELTSPPSGVLVARSCRTKR
ncbi:hypothetical protein KFK09_016697 [Dendrobium nobile]|uniref:Late embryogenesis abundant protein LEA-2 subgroup domain-containing protein n=1 Tax=Dendrobium nobile TaxID=94219 RepID=A0A8T3B1C5_DENNO|nr:hypothetical protein KFK09_016697 [Dendrobium nobile]